ncbi:MAG: transglutaminase domain-containing protein [Planctomycetes bacterium]|nr:transglutaminase domain-containing protein [Planctomycetota bacterium]MBL7144121.1 transglutaminase domain-containing protein [Phycisphaerae bacterium]
MKTQKAIAIIIVLTSSLLTGLVSGDIAYPTILCMLGLLGLQRRFTWDIRPERRVITSLLLLFLAVMFSIHYRYANSFHRVTSVQAEVVAWQTIARYFLASMILILFLGRPDQFPSSLGLFHVAVTISAGQVLLLNDMHITFRLSELLSVILVVLYAASAHGSMDRRIPGRLWRMSRWLAFTLIVVVTVNGGWIVSSILYRHVEVLNLPVLFWGKATALESTSGSMARVGFSTSGKLSSVLLIKGELDPTPALSISSDISPGYLRARSFDVYLQSEWHDLSTQEAILPEKHMTIGMYFVGRTNVFSLDKVEASRCQFMTIRHESRFDDTMFTPLGTSFIEAPVKVLMRDGDDIVYNPISHSGLSYRIAYTKSASQKSPTGMMNIPNELDPRVHELAGRIFTGCTTTDEKIKAVISYFRTNYTYVLGLNIPPGRDKLTHFLLEESTGYCEYFASGAAILLRLADVPTRYVTGFLVTAKDEQSESWIARNMDAHAWVEAWDEQQNKWTIVEATQGEDLDAAPALEELDRMGGGIGSLGQLLQALYQYGLVGVLGWLVDSFGVLKSLVLLLSLLGGGLSLALLRYSRKRSKYKTNLKQPQNLEILTLHKMLTGMDRKVKAAGSQRHFNEPLHAFSQQLRRRDSGSGFWTRISDWYFEYANLRYCRKISSERVQKLQQLYKGLRDSF